MPSSCKIVLKVIRIIDLSAKPYKGEIISNIKKALLLGTARLISFKTLEKLMSSKESSYEVITHEHPLCLFLIFKIF